MGGQEGSDVRRLRGVHRQQARYPRGQVGRLLGRAQRDDGVPPDRVAREVGLHELLPRSAHPLEEAGQARRRRQLQPRQRLLQLVPRRGDGLHVGLVRDPRSVARGGAVHEDRSLLRQAPSEEGRDAPRHRLRLGNLRRARRRRSARRRSASVSPKSRSPTASTASSSTASRTSRRSKSATTAT